MFGRDVVLDTSRDQNQTRCVNLAESRASRASNLASLDDIYAKVADNLTLSFLRNSKYYNRNRHSVTFNVGDIVWRRNFSRSSGADYFSSKFAPRFIKTRVRRVLSSQVYELEDCDSPHVGTYHVKDILK